MIVHGDYFVSYSTKFDGVADAQFISFVGLDVIVLVICHVLHTQPKLLAGRSFFFFGIFTVMNVKTISIAFPFMTLLCIPARMYFMPMFFEGWELNLLDGDDDKIKEWTVAKEESTRALAMDEESGENSSADDDNEVDA